MNGIINILLGYQHSLTDNRTIHLHKEHISLYPCIQAVLLQILRRNVDLAVNLLNGIPYGFLVKRASRRYLVLDPLLIISMTITRNKNEAKTKIIYPPVSALTAYRT